MRLRATRTVLLGCALACALVAPRRARARRPRPWTGACYPGDGSTRRDDHRLRVHARRRGAAPDRRRASSASTARRRRGQRQHDLPGAGAAGGAARRRASRPTRSRSSTAPCARRRRSASARDGRRLPAERRGSPATLEVRFSAYGFGVRDAGRVADAGRLRPLRRPARQGAPDVIARRRAPRPCGTISADGAAQAVPVRPAPRALDAAVRHEPGVPPRHRRQPVRVRPR